MERTIKTIACGDRHWGSWRKKPLVAAILVLLLLVAGGTSAFAMEGLQLQALDVGASAGVPLGKYREISLFNGGAESRLLIGVSGLESVFALANVQILGNLPAVEGTFVLDFSVSVGGGVTFPLSEKLGLSIYGAYGLMPHLATGDWGNGVSGTLLFLDQIVSVGVDLEIALSSRSAIYIRPQYTLFPETDNTGHIIGLQSGYRFLFGEEK